MIRRLFSSQIKSITGAAILLGSASFVSRIIGVLRDRIFAHEFGAGPTLDAYYAAFRIPDLVYNLLVIGALSAGFIPVFLKVYEKNKKKAWEVTNGIIHILGLGLIITCTILFIFTPQIVPLLVPGFSGEKLKLTIILTRIMFFSPFLLGLSSVVSGVLQATKSFFIYALTPIMYNLGIIVGALFFVPIFGEIGLAFGVILGALMHLLIQLPTFFKQGYRYKFVFNLKDKFVREIAKLMVPRTLGLATSQLHILVITYLASTLSEGSLTIFNFANNLQHFPIGIIGYSFAIAAFPTLSYLAAKNKKEEISQHISSTTRQILFLIIPLTIIFLLLRAQIVRVVLGSGAFDWTATILTANTLAFFTLSLFAQCLIPLFARTFYALEDTMTPFIISFIAAGVNIALGIYLKDILGVAGLALAFSAAMIIQLSFLWLFLKLKLGSLGEVVILKSLNKIIFSAFWMAITIQVLKTPLSNMFNMTTFKGILAQGFFAGMSGIFVYIIICYLLKLPELKHILSSLTKKWLKLRNVQAEINEADEV
ncbi:MAG: murein biosynthesis integral membrane protein MurJ [Candidatus Magasanikbacteria bacterium]|nr:murein biosynthesis integral membrane protein MurJ [Candidatus Magasanikbacteria bacterium]